MKHWKLGVVVACVLGSRSAHADDVATRVVGGSGGVVMMQNGARWSEVCVSPCTATMQRDAVYKIGGNSVRESNPFRFKPEHDSVTMAIDAARPVPRVVGLIVGIIGSTLATAGSAAFFLSTSGGYFQSVGTAAVGIVAFGVGLIATVIGFATFASHQRTRVHLTF